MNAEILLRDLKEARTLLEKLQNRDASTTLRYSELNLEINVKLLDPSEDVVFDVSPYAEIYEEWTRMADLEGQMSRSTNVLRDPKTDKLISLTVTGSASSVIWFASAIFNYHLYRPTFWEPMPIDRSSPLTQELSYVSAIDGKLVYEQGCQRCEIMFPLVPST